MTDKQCYKTFMKIKLFKDCKDQCPKGVRLLGMDVGRKTLGLALSDSGQSLATPLMTIQRTKFSKDMEQLKAVLEEYEIGGFIVGWPINMDGTLSRTCDMVQSFVDEMRQHTDVIGQKPFIAFIDERLSTSEVDNSLDNRVDMKRSDKRGAKEKGLVDQLAAQIILQGALDSIQKT